MLPRNESTVSTKYSIRNSPSPSRNSNDVIRHSPSLSAKEMPIINKTTSESEIPPDTAYSWVIVAAAAVNLMCTLGIINSFGVFSTYYLNFIFPNTSAVNIAWIGTCISFFMLGCSIFTGPLTDRFGFRNLSLVGTAICCTALLLASFATEVWQLLLSQGIMFGIGGACIFSPSVSLPAQWHEKRRPLATGIAVAGSGLGGMVFTEITQKLMDSIGPHWTLRALSLILLCTSAPAGMFYRRRINIPRGGVDFAGIARDPRLIVIGMAGLFVNASYFVPWYYLPSAALNIDQSRTASNNLVLYMNAGSTVGRILAAYVAIAMGPINSIAIAYFICAVLVLVVLLVVKSMAGYICLAVVYGSLSASFISITPLVLANIFGAASVATSMGLMNAMCAIGIIIGNPSQGAIYQRFDRPHKSFTAISIWGFAGLFLAVCCYIVLKAIVIRGTTHRLWSKL